MYCEIFATAEAGDQLITPNQRLATRLHQWHQQQQDHSAWASPNINALPDWLMKLWQHIGNRSVLSTQAQLALWQPIVQDHLEQHHQLGSARALAELAQQAYDHLQLWGLSLADVTPHITQNDHQCFIEWAQQFEQLCQQHNAITQSQLASALKHRLNATQQASLPKRIRLYGFDQLPPSQQQLFNSLAHYITVEYLSPPQRNQQQQRVECDDLKHELLAMANWAKQQLQQGKQRIGCVHPQLSQIRHSMETVFQQTFSDASEAYNISSGQPLAQCDMIACALDVLSINLNRIDVNQFSRLIRSPYINGNQCDMACGAFLDQALLQRGQLSITSTQLEALLSACIRVYPKNSLVQRIRLWQQNEQSTPSNDWLTHRLNSLYALGWPGQRGFDSIEHQMHQHWQQVLEQFIALQPYLEQQTPCSQLQQLRHLCQQHTFQAKTAEAPIQVLGVLEAAGNDFESLWIAGLTDDIWPPAAKPNPFLPFQWQRQQKLPHASAEREYHYCQQLTQQLVSACPEVMVSHATLDGDTTLQPSSLISEMPVTQTPAIKTNSPALSLVEWQLIDDQQAPAIEAEETIKGGSWIISQQANCPFKAFANIRLNAQALAELHEGIDARLKGSLVHAALDYCWQHLKDQQQLLNLSDLALDTLIDQAIEHALNEYQLNTVSLSIACEQQRLKRLLIDWLQFEKQRPPFRVKHSEQRFDYPLQQLSLHIIVDRIDELNSGDTLVIDYKTGLQSLTGWFDERLTQPQLPLYATLPDLTVDAISYAEVKRGKFSFKGVSADDTEHKGIQTIEKSKASDSQSWSECLQQWRTQLNLLATEFIQGVASVSPAETSAPCLHCDLRPLCRINQ